MTSTPPIRIFHLDPCRLVRQGLEALLSAREGIVLVGGACGVEEALEQWKELSFDVLVTELHLGNQMVDLGLLRRARPGLPIVVLTHQESDHAALSAIESGASSFLKKNVPLEDLVRAVQAAKNGWYYLPASLTESILRGIRNPFPPPTLPPLTPRELGILTAVSEGASNNEISEAIGLSVSTVKAQLRRLYKKLEVSGRTELVVAAMNMGLVKPKADQSFSTPSFTGRSSKPRRTAETSSSPRSLQP